MKYPSPLPNISLNPRYMIDANKPTHIVWWAHTLNVSERELRSALDEVGPCALEVYCYLRDVAARRELPDKMVFTSSDAACRSRTPAPSE